MILKATEGSTSSDVLDNGFGVSTAGLQAESEPRRSFTESPRHVCKCNVGPRRGTLGGDILTD